MEDFTKKGIFFVSTGLDDCGAAILTYRWTLLISLKASSSNTDMSLEHPQTVSDFEKPFLTSWMGKPFRIHKKCLELPYRTKVVNLCSLPSKHNMKANSPSQPVMTSFHQYVNSDFMIFPKMFLSSKHKIISFILKHHEANFLSFHLKAFTTASSSPGGAS